MADLTITINPPTTNTITISDGVLPHNSSHAPGGSDSVETWYAKIGDLEYVSGQIGAPAGVVFITGDQNVSGVKNFYSRPTVNGSGIMLAGETAGTGYLTGYVNKSETGSFVSSANTGSFVTTSQTGQFTGVFYPYSANPAAYIQGAVVRPSNTGELVDKGSSQTISGQKIFTKTITAPTGFFGISNTSGIFEGQVMAGGGYNGVGGLFASVLGGAYNHASGDYSCVVGGVSSSASGSNCVVFGSANSIESGISSIILGGENNRIADSLDCSVIGGVNHQIIESSYSSTIGGASNTISGGRYNQIFGDSQFITNSEYSISMGQNSLIQDSTGIFSIGDQSSITNSTSILSFGNQNSITDVNNSIILSSSPTTSSGSYTAILHYDSGIYLNGPVFFNNRPTYNGTGFLLSGEVSVVNTGYLTGYAPIADSITGISVAGSTTKTITLYQYDGSALTASFTDQQGTGGAGEDLYIYSGSFNTSDGNLTLNRTGDSGTVIISLDGRYVTGLVVRPAETGSFYSATNPSGYITGVDLSPYATIASTTGISGYLQTQITSNNQTGAFLTTGAADSRYALQSATGTYTGEFYPRSSNPSNYLIAADLSNYATQAYVTGISGHLQGQITTLNSQTGNYATGSVVRSSETGNFITTSQTGQFYAVSNPQGFITGVDLSTYATTGYVTGVSGYLESLISASSAGVGSLNGLSGVLTLAGAGTNTISVAGSTITVSGSTGHLSNYVLTSQTGAFLTTGEADIRYVNATGDTINGNLEVTGYTSGQSFAVKVSGYIDFQSGTPAWKEGRVFYDTDSHTLSYYNEQSDMTLNVGQENVIRISNGETGNILNGKVVYISGSQGNRPVGYLATATSGSSVWERTIGIATHDIATQGYVTTFGTVNGLNTTGFLEGDHLYLSDSTAGEFTTTIPTSPSHKVQVGTVLRSHATQGSILVTIDPGNHLWNLHDVKQGPWTNDQILRYNQPSGYWEARDLNTGIFAQTSYVTGISGYQGGLISSLQLATGNLNTRLTTVEGVTGSFVTGVVVRQSETGAFLTTGAADSRYSRIPYVSEVYIDAGAMLTGVSGATPTTVEVSTAGIYYDAYQFDATTTGFAQFKIKLADYNLGNVRAKFDWTTSGTGGAVVWGIQGLAVGNGEILSSAWSTGVEVTDTFITGTGQHLSDAITFSPTGSIQSGDMLYFRVYRSAANAADTLTANASLLGLSLQYTGNSITTW